MKFIVLRDSDNDIKPIIFIESRVFGDAEEEISSIQGKEVMGEISASVDISRRMSEVEYESFVVDSGIEML